MKAITTTYRCPTDTRGARITAREPDGARITIPYPHELSETDCHRAAADALLAQCGWKGEYVTGYQSDGVYVHVFTEE